MPKHLFLAATAVAMFVAGAPAFSQDDVGSNGVTGDYDRRGGRDASFQDMKADLAQRGKSVDELAVGADLVKQQRFSEALPHLELALNKKPRNSITLIYLGFSHRMIGAGLTGEPRDSEYKKALDYYLQAKKIDPSNRLLHEYMGKLYLLMRDPVSADNELKTLQELCPTGCVERDTLSNALLAYVASTVPLGASPPAPPAK